MTPMMKRKPRIEPRRPAKPIGRVSCMDCAHAHLVQWEGDAVVISLCKARPDALIGYVREVAKHPMPCLLWEAAKRLPLPIERR